MRLFNFFILAAVLLAAASVSMAASSPHLEVLSWEHYVGDAKIGDTVFVEFPVHNTGDAPLIFSNVRTSCYCTVAEVDSPIAPGETGRIRMFVETSDISYGPFVKTLSIETNDPSYPIAVFQAHGAIKAFIQRLPGTSGLLIRSHRGYTKEYKFVFHSEMTEFEILEATSDLDYIVPSFERSEKNIDRIENSGRKTEQCDVRKGDWVLTVKLLSSAPSGSSHGFVTVKTDYAQFPELRFPVNLTVHDFIPGQ